MQSVKVDYHVVRNIEDATHWLACEDCNAELSCVTPDCLYSVCFDQQEQQYYVIDNDGYRSFVDLCHKGEYVTLDTLAQ